MITEKYYSQDNQEFPFIQKEKNASNILAGIDHFTSNEPTNAMAKK